MLYHRAEKMSPQKNSSVVFVSVLSSLILCTVVGGWMIYSSNRAKNDAPNGSGHQVALNDAELLVGTWACKEMYDNGRTFPYAENLRAEFTKTNAKIGDLKGKFFLDLKTSPKHCMIQLIDSKLNVSYQVTDGELILAIPLAAIGSTEATTFPTDFKPERDRLVGKYRKLTEAEAAADKTKRENVVKDEPVALESLRSDIKALVELLKEKKFDEVMQIVYGVPKGTRVDSATKKKNEATLKKLKSGHDKVLITFFDNISTERPTFSQNNSRAAYDIRHIKVKGMPTLSSITFVKADGKWKPTEEKESTSGDEARDLIERALLK